MFAKRYTQPSASRTKCYGDGVHGDGDNVTGMGWGWGCKFIPMSVFNLYPLWSPTLQGNVERFSVEATSNVDGDSDLPV